MLAVQRAGKAAEDPANKSIDNNNNNVRPRALRVETAKMRFKQNKNANLQ